MLPLNHEYICIMKTETLHLPLHNKEQLAWKSSLWPRGTSPTQEGRQQQQPAGHREEQGAGRLTAALLRARICKAAWLQPAGENQLLPPRGYKWLRRCMCYGSRQDGLREEVGVFVWWCGEPQHKQYVEDVGL